jgi:thiamine biosynthesis protein ThiI
VASDPNGPKGRPEPASRTTPTERLVMLRFSGDLGTKARATRRQFQRRLVANLEDALASGGSAPRLHLSHDRIFAEIQRDEEIEALGRVFGVQSISLVEKRSVGGLSDVVRAGEDLFREQVRGRRFAVRARRVGDRSRIPIHGGEVELSLGTALLPAADGVDLDHPEVTVQVELLEGEACFFVDRISAPGGLPLGVEGRAVALLSGGFDSAVAAWQLLKRGVRLDYVFCNLGGASHLQGVLRVAQVLADRWCYGHRPRLHAIDFEPLAAEIRERTGTRYWQILLKRLMLRAAESVARRRHAIAIVTGDAMGQVSSQTLQNLAVVDRATQRLVLRPLVGFNKEEIIDLSRAIGTYDLSRVVGEYCAMVPRRPATAASLAAILEEEEKLDASLLDHAVAMRRSFDLRDLDVEKLEGAGPSVERIPAGAIVLDLRSAHEYREWHYPDALRLDFSQAVEAYPSFDRDPTYVLYCEFGLKSAHLAEMMRREGLDALAFRGGIGALKRTVD